MPLKHGGRVGRKYLYRTETGEVTHSSDPNIPVGSNVYEENIIKKRKTKKELEQEKQRRIREEQERNRPTEDKSNRVRNIVRNLNGLETPDVLMKQIMDTLDPSGKIPSPGLFYTFMYIAKTPNIQYDKHPLIYVETLETWGFLGFNFHWGLHRKYTWKEVQTSLYEVKPGELSDMREIPYAKFLNS